MPTVTVGGVGWSVLPFFFVTAQSLPPWIYRRRCTAVFTIATAAPQMLPPRRNHHTTTTTSVTIPTASAQLLPPPEIHRFNIVAAAPSPLLQLHLFHRGSIVIALPLSLTLHSPCCNCRRRFATAIFPPLPLLKSLTSPLNYHHPLPSAA